MKALIFVAMSLIIQSALATTACICEIESEKASVTQRATFSIGCNVWLKEQKDCVSKQKLEHGADLSAVDLQPGVDTVKVGYVGHWTNSTRMVNYLSFTITPLIYKKGVSVVVDNTACRAMSNPQEIYDYVKQMVIPPNQSIQVRGYQTESMGKWDVVLGKDIAVPALVSSASDQIQYTSCKPFMNRNCVRRIVREETATCIGNSGELEKIQCCQVLGGRNAWQPAGCQ